MFYSPLGMALAAAVIGALANVGRIWLVDRGWVIQAATVVACVAVGVLAAFASKWWKYPHITLSVPATLIMIPGARVYKTMVSLNGGVSQDAVVTGLDASLVLLAIAVGLVIAKLLTDPAWSFEKVRKRR
jgi:uncharacterized membrane protein YjjB (DUF3815 family)